MKSAFFLPFALLLGLVIGGWAPKEELRGVRSELAALSAKLAARDKPQRFDAFTRIVQIPDRAQPAKPAAAPAAKAAADAQKAEPTAAARLSVAVAPATNAASQAAEAKKEPPKPEDLRARIDEAKELWMTRVEVARAQWLQRLKLSPEETAQFDSVINVMNESLYASMQNLADVMAASDTLTPESGLRAFNEMTSVLVKTYDELGAIIPAAQQGEAAQLELTDFIDPAIAEPLVAVQDKLDKLPPERRPGARLRR